jgi:hypothetical protein
VIFGVYLACPAALAGQSLSLVVTWKQQRQSLGAAEFKKFKKISSREKDPQDGKTVEWKGVLLSSVVESVLSQSPPELRATVDLVVVTGARGKVALIPRAFLGKYSILLADRRGGQELAASAGPLELVLPWTSQPKLEQEGISPSGYFVSSVESIELTSYRDRYPQIFLNRRTDPSAMRGEKLFLRSCVSCHGGVGNLKDMPFHPKGVDGFSLGDRDRRAIEGYLTAYRLERASR